MSNLHQGLFTSPHLTVVRERIRLNGSKLSEENFTKYFFECWDKLDSNKKVREKKYLIQYKFNIELIHITFSLGW